MLKKQESLEKITENYSNLKNYNTIILDVETTKKGDIFDFSYAVIVKGVIKRLRTFLVTEIIADGAHKSAFYYEENKEFYNNFPADRIRTWSEIRKEFNKDLIEHKIEILAAYNCKFDINAVNKMNESMGIEKVINSETLSKLNINLVCIMKSALQYICNDRNKEYIDYAITNGYVTAKGNVRTSAEAVYNYVMKSSPDEMKKEEHNGVADCVDEFVIMYHVMRELTMEDAVKATNSSITWKKI